MPKVTQKTYRELNDELEALLIELQSDDIDIDKAFQRYERGLELVTLLEKHLKTAENSITELKSRAT